MNLPKKWEAIARGGGVMSELIERLRDVMTRIGNMCAEGRPPKMSIPARPDYDDDIIICESVKAGIAALEEQARRIAELEARLTQVEVNTANLKTIFRVHALRYIPNVTDTQIDEAIARACRGVGI